MIQVANRFRLCVYGKYYKREDIQYDSISVECKRHEGLHCVSFAHHSMPSAQNCDWHKAHAPQMLRNGYFGKSEFDVLSFPKRGPGALWFRTSCGVKAAQEKGEQRRRTGRSAGAAGVLLLGGSLGLGRPDRRSARTKGAARARDRRALCLVSRGGVSKAR